MAIIELSVIPIGTGTPSLSQYVARAVQLLKDEQDIKYELTAMGTIIEGDLVKLMALAVKMHNSAFAAGVQRVVTIVKIDERHDKISSIQGKVASVKEKL